MERTVDELAVIQNSITECPLTFLDQTVVADSVTEFNEGRAKSSRHSSSNKFLKERAFLVPANSAPPRAFMAKAFAA